MSAIPYLNTGHNLDASSWNALWTEADALLSKRLSSQSLFLTNWEADSDTTHPLIYQKTFFFGTTITYPTASALTTMANSAMYGYHPYSFNTRIYSDAALIDWVNSATIDTWWPMSHSLWPVENERSGGLIRLVMPTTDEWTTLATALWPEYVGTVATSIDFLDYSLRIHKRTIDGVDCNVCVAASSSTFPCHVEHQHWWEPIDVVFLDGSGTAVDWPLEYDKYRLLRFNNLQSQSMVVNCQQKINWTFSGNITVTIPAMESKCVRMTSYGHNRGWVPGGRYFQEVLPLDPWFRSIGEATIYLDTWQGNRCNITDPLNVARILAYTPLQPYGPPIDMNKVWDTRALYFGSGIGGDSNHIGTPSGSWFGSLLDTSTPLGDLIFHKGKMVAVNPEDSLDKRFIDYTGIANLGSNLAVITASVVDSATDANYIEVTTTQDWDLIGLTTNLLYDGFAVPGVTLSTTKKVFGPVDFDYTLIDETAFVRLAATVVTSSADVYWNTWTWDGVNYSSIAIVGTDSCSVNNTNYTLGTVTVGPWNLKTPLSTMISDIEDYDAGAITNTVTPKATIFGPGLMVSKSINALYPIDNLIYMSGIVT